MIRFALIILALMTGPAAAQEVVFSPAATLACIDGLPDRDDARDCFGVSATQCMSDTPGGYSTVGEGACIYAEAEYWDGRLNAVYQALRLEDAAQDAENGDYAPSQVEALRDMQRAWIAFRDATCAYEASQWGGGTGQGPAYAGCTLRLTASQTLYLENQRGM